MEWILRMNKALEYLEEHLTQGADLEEAARIACCSVYHFQRIFPCLAGIPLSDYLRRRRMSLAASDLLAGQKVLDVALKYGYDSPTAFNRAFQNVHGMPPSKVQEGAPLKAFPPISFRITVKGATEMEYRIVKKEAFRVLGISAPISPNIEESFQEVPALWNRADEENLPARLLPLMDPENPGLLGICDGVGEQPRYIIAVASAAPLGEGTEGLEEHQVPAGTWAVFPGEGPMPGAIQELEQRVVAEWLPTSGYEYANAPDIEVYLRPDPKNARFEVWIPVVKAGKEEL